MAKATGATVVTTLADMDGNETFDASNLGSAEEVRWPLRLDSLLHILLCHNSRPAPAYNCAASVLRLSACMRLHCSLAQ